MLCFTPRCGSCIWVELPHRHGITHLRVKNDSKVLVDVITKNCNINRSVPTLIWHTSLKTWIDKYKLTILDRKGNKAADWLTNFILTLNAFNLHTIETASRESLWWHIWRLYASECLFRFVVLFLVLFYTKKISFLMSFEVVI